MPRLKAVLSGIVPSYLDVVLNLASTEFLEENWLKSAINSGKKTIFYGDDTWLKMFPEMFDRFEGTVSFFVTDFTEVDDNVTRHLETEIKQKLNTWDVLILHYLGLDHIGHSLGARSPYIDLKLKEMDEIIEDIYKNLTDSDSSFLVLVLGDHGMAAEGGHGGATYLETHVPVVGLPRFREDFRISSKKTIIEQVDLAPTISSLLGLEVPLNSLGINFFSEVFEKEKNKFLTFSLMKNGIQLKNIIKKSINRLDPRLIHEFDTCLVNLTAVSCRKLPATPTLVSDCRRVFQNLQSELIHLSANYNYNFLIPGLIASLIGTIFAFVDIKDEFSNIIIYPEYFLVLLQPLISFASSYVEEEKLVWNFLFSTILTILLWRKLGEKVQNRKEQTSLLLVMVLHRISSRIRPDLLELEKSNFGFEFSLISFVILSLLLMFLHSGSISIKIALFISLLSKQLQFPESWMSVDGFFLMSFYLAFFCQLTLAKSSDFILFWCLSLASVPNRFILLLLMLSSYLTRILKKNHSIIVYLLVATGFYATGNSHSLATLDLSSSYSRLPFYNPILVGIQLFIVGYSGPIISLMSLQSKDLKFSKFLIFCRSCSLLFCLAALFHHRHHLFVWSVFAPKLVYEIFHFFGASVLSIIVRFPSIKIGQFVLFSYNRSFKFLFEAAVLSLFLLRFNFLLPGFQETG